MSQIRHVQTQKNIRVLENRLDKVKLMCLFIGRLVLKKTDFFGIGE